MKSADQETRIVSVPLSGDRGYEIQVAHGILAGVGPLIRQVAHGSRAVIVSQPRIARTWAAPLRHSLTSAGFGDVPVVTFPAGERYKTVGIVSGLYQKLYDLVPAIDRKTLIIALGGGVVGDVAGFVAASYLRGLPYIQIPTTLLAMVDSSVGGKTGVDFRDGKNLIGAFHQPRAVYIDTQVLMTLPKRELRSGMGEIIKYGIIADPGILASLMDRRIDLKPFDFDFLAELIARCCEIKADVVTRDEFEETGIRATLNFGHTIGHAIESVTKYRRFRHGEAIAMGMVAAAHIGELTGETPPDVRETLVALLRAQGLPISVPRDIPAESIVALLGRDKKAAAGQARFVLARSIGDVRLVSKVDAGAVAEGLNRSYGAEQ